MRLFYRSSIWIIEILAGYSLMFNALEKPSISQKKVQSDSREAEFKDL